MLLLVKLGREKKEFKQFVKNEVVFTQLFDVLSMLATLMHTQLHDVHYDKWDSLFLKQLVNKCTFSHS